MIKIMIFIVLIGFILGSILFTRAGDAVRQLISGINENFIAFLPIEVKLLLIVMFSISMITLAFKFGGND